MVKISARHVFHNSLLISFLRMLSVIKFLKIETKVFLKESVIAIETIKDTIVDTTKDITMNILILTSRPTGAFYLLNSAL